MVVIRDCRHETRYERNSSIGVGTETRTCAKPHYPTGRRAAVDDIGQAVAVDVSRDHSAESLVVEPTCQRVDKRVRVPARHVEIPLWRAQVERLDLVMLTI